ncbi:hypothetical protein ACLBKT_09340 [Erythrobacter sp. W302b]|uniref:hypothetical protein n=1 Tax=Erythrobacter sp. W302b TaxID=3389874 RepID=UPI00396B2937
MTRFLALICGTVLLAGCAQRPESVIVEFHRAVEDGQHDKAMSKLSPQLTGMLGEEKLRGVLATQTEEIAACGGIADITTDLNGDKTVQRGMVSITYGGTCEPKTQKVKLVKIDDEWKISADK